MIGRAHKIRVIIAKGLYRGISLNSLYNGAQHYICGDGSGYKRYSGEVYQENDES